MNNELVSLEIAKHLEPNPTYEQRNDFSRQIPDWIEDEDGDFYLSDGGCWVAVYRGSDKWDLYQRDFVEDEETGIALFRLMIDDEDFQSACKRIASTQAAVDDGTSASLLAAIAEAFAKMKGLSCP